MSCCTMSFGSAMGCLVLLVAFVIVGMVGHLSLGLAVVLVGAYVLGVIDGGDV